MTFGKKSLYIVLVLICCIAPLSAIQYNSVDIDEPIYGILQVLENRGVLPTLSRVKPYPLAYILGLCETALSESSEISAAERQNLESYIAEHTPGHDAEEGIFEKGKVSVFDSEDSRQVEVGAFITSDWAFDVSDLEHYDSRNAVEAYANGGAGDILSFNMDAGIRADKLSTYAWAPLNDEGWSPYLFSIPGEGAYYTYGNGTGNNVGYPDAENDEVWMNGFHTTPEVTLMLFDQDLMLRWGMIDRDWGPASGNLVISEQARNFDAVEMHWDVAEWAHFSYLTGTLTDTDDSDTHQNMLTTKRVDIDLPTGLSVGLHETVLWPKRFELGYLNPFMISTLYQNILGDYDNMFAGGDFSWNIAESGRVYGTFMVDEMNDHNPLLWTTNPRNIFSYQGGLEYSSDLLPFLQIRLQYTKLEPFFYSHYAQYYPTYAEDRDDSENLMDTSYMNKGENLGYYLRPNSDEFKLEVSAMLSPRVSVDTRYMYIRHSDQYGSEMEDNDGYSGIDELASKDFLGFLTEKAHIIDTEVSWEIPETPISISAGYIFCYSSIREYDEENTSEPFTEWGSHISHAARIGFQVYGD